MRTGPTVENAVVEKVLDELQCGIMTNLSVLWQFLQENAIIIGRQSRGTDEQLAQDIAQEVMIRFYKMGFRPKSESASSNLPGYLYRALQHEYQNYFKPRSRQAESSWEALSPGSQRAAEQQFTEDWTSESELGKTREGLLNQIEALLGSSGALTDGCRDLIDSIYLRKEARKSIADRLGIGVDSVYVKLSRCLDSLRKAVGGSK